MSEKLKPCPFCHDSAYPQDSNPYSKRGYWAVICSNCEAEGPAANNELDAIALWNRRSDMAAVLADVAPTEAELKSANYLNEISGPGFMHRQHLAPINALVQRILSAWNRRELESASQPGGVEAVKVDTVHANFTPFYIMSNVRRIVPAYYNKQRANWVLAMDVFAVGSRSARQICWDAGIDPDGYAIISVSNSAAPSAGNGGAEGA